MEAFGNWEYIPPTDKFDSSVKSEKGKIICYTPRNSKEDRQNAKLISAAPDLLRACKKVLTGGYGCAPSVEFMDKLKKECENAINKS